MFRTVVHNVLVGSVSFASPGAKALHNASTAQEITVITESASSFQFKVRGNDIKLFLSFILSGPILTITSVFFVAMGRSVPDAKKSYPISHGPPCFAITINVLVLEQLKSAEFRKPKQKISFF